MGLLNFPTSADGGVLIVILVNTAISFSIFKHVVLSILNVMGIHIASWEEYSIDSTVDMFECRGSPPETYMEEFRCRTPSIRFDSLCSCEHPEQKCSICQNEFEPDAEINCLSCGHFFHKLCLEKWLKYWRVTCPNCRTCMMPQEEEDTCPMSYILEGLLVNSGSLGPAANSESLEPIELLGVRPEFLWYLQRKDPAWVVGEHRQLYFMLDDFRWPIGVDGAEDTSVAFFTSTRFMCGITMFFFSAFSSILALPWIELRRTSYDHSFFVQTRHRQQNDHIAVANTFLNCFT